MKNGFGVKFSLTLLVTTLGSGRLVVCRILSSGGHWETNAPTDIQYETLKQKPFSSSFAFSSTSSTMGPNYAVSSRAEPHLLTQLVVVSKVNKTLRTLFCCIMPVFLLAATGGITRSWSVVVF